MAAEAGAGSDDRHVDVVVVGAGTSGLICATALCTASEVGRVAVLDARRGVGGRLLATHGCDLGGGWTWPSQEPRVALWSKKLQLKSTPQQLSGDAFLGHEGGRPKNVGNLGSRIAPCGDGAQRFRGGYASLPKALAAALPDGVLRLGCQVVALESRDGGVQVTYRPVAAAAPDSPEQRQGSTEAAGPTATLWARRVVVAAPPAVVARTVTFEPDLPRDKRRLMENTATWCGDWCKVVAIFRSPFWRRRGASGVCTTSGALSIWWEGAGGADTDEEQAALIGLGFGEEACREVARHAGASASVDGDSGQELRQLVVSQLGEIFGRPAEVEEQLVTVRHKAWAEDPLTYDGKAQRRDYGHPLLQKATDWGVHFAGTETEDWAGHVEGAIAAGERAAKEVLSALR